MVRWVVEILTIEDKKFRNSRMELMGSFKAKDLKQMYHILDPQDIYENSYLAKFSKKNEESFNVLRSPFNENENKRNNSISPYGYEKNRHRSIPAHFNF